MDENSFSLKVKNGIPCKEELVAALRVVRAHAVRVYKTLTLEEARIERLMKGNCRGRQIILSHFPQEHNSKKNQPFLPIQSHSNSQH